MPRPLPAWPDHRLTDRAASVVDCSRDQEGIGAWLPIDGEIAPPEPSLPHGSHADRAALAGLLERSASALGSVIEDFSFTRAVVRLPTMSSIVLLWWRLAGRSM